ncbi:Exodeoxyribonuclease 7 large subunit [uncultured archaeon]|nr:Exodeoxyribonuclease 7 large subunit [uncultured archaeon]
MNLDPADSYSVAALSQCIEQVLSSSPQFNDVLLKGEISNLTRAASGHIYFSLKDEDYIIACALFRQFQSGDCNELCDGLQVVALGSIMVYVPRSQYQLSIKKITPIGKGSSSLELERLRDKLNAEGLFNQERKKPVPRLPRKVGIITSKDSAAIKDILAVVNAQCPEMDLVFAYVTSQGDSASSNMVQAFNWLATMKGIDAIIIARGGGPSEDFMVFNDEYLVRAIASSTKPIITGIGHERDVCLADLAADYRASTPSTAARAVIPDILEMRNGLSSLRTSLVRSYDSYRRTIEIKEKEDELGKKDKERNIIRYQAAIVFLIALLMLIMAIFLLRG